MEEQSSSKKWLWITLAVVLVLLFSGLLWYFFSETKGGEVLKRAFPFGTPSENTGELSDSSRESDGSSSREGEGGTLSGGEAMFRQLTTRVITGAHTLERDGVGYVRYVARENGNTYEVNLESGAEEQLTVTTIPRVQLADWALGGNAVVFRYLERDPLSGREVVKAHLGRLPAQAGLSTATSSAQSGNKDRDLSIEFLPDNIIALSIAPDGKVLFYLIKTANGVSGSIVNLDTRTTQEVFRNAFSEWSPQLLNDDTIILTAKPSGGVAGYSYRYDWKSKTLERLVREKIGLTTLGNSLGSRVLYGENIAGNSLLGVYSGSGFPGDEGTVFYEKTIPLATLPEKCAWLNGGIHALCGSFVNTPSGLIPDLWYQGALSFNDTFWSINTDTDEVAYLADPKTEIGQEFDVVSPMISTDGDYLIFTNKKDGTLWSFRIPLGIAPTESAQTLPANLSPDELQDAQGSLPGNSPR